MSNSTVDASKRTWLIASSCAGAVGAGFVAVPFVSSFQPSERAKAAGAPVEVDISALEPGQKMTVEWRGKPVWILRRTPEMLAGIKKVDSEKQLMYQIGQDTSHLNWGSATGYYVRIDDTWYPVHWDEAQKLKELKIGDSVNLIQVNLFPVLGKMTLSQTVVG